MISGTSAQNSPTLVVGGSGRLGQMLQAFWPKGAGLRLHSTRTRSDFVVFDLILEPSKARACMGGIGTVLCLAGVTPARAKAKAEGLSRNTDLAVAAIRAAHAAGAGRVLLASSAAVYGNAAGILAEDRDLQPTAPYGQAKLEMERAALDEAHALGMPVSILRIGNVAGADAILGGWRAGMLIDQLPDGTTPRRSYIGPRTLAHTLHRLTTLADVPEVLNIAAPGTVEMGALLDAAGLAWSARPAPESVIAEVALSTHLLEAHVPLPADAGTAPALVAEWRALQDLC
jgi:nucleoside-diphosphate-sugar epimerase